MEFKCTINFTIEADNFTEAEKKAEEKIFLPNFEYENLEIVCSDDEIIEQLKLKAYVQISEYRKKVMMVLKNAGIDGMMPSEMAIESGILQNHISKVLKELSDKDLIVCINPRARKGRIYRLTETGQKIGNLI